MFVIQRHDRATAEPQLRPPNEERTRPLKCQRAPADAGLCEPFMVQSLATDGLTIEPHDERSSGGDTIRLFWKGRSTARNPGELLVPYFQGIFQSVVESGRATVEMHFERMEHFNSSTVGALIYLIQDARGR